MKRMEEVERVRMPKEGEVLGVVETMLGANKMRVRCQDGKLRTIRIPGKMRKKIWIRERDVVLVKPWPIQYETNGDVVWKYRVNQAVWLKKKGILNMEF
jgi:translation initiation factor 1A